ncbi:putative sialyltransferase-like protein [Haemophilus haemolyticus M21639]|nr:putative sialyltransferase-like protein [Haemophilus haemolyticus M21639]
MKKITLYLDPATLPALAQLIHFLQNKEEESFRIFCYNRYPLLENVIRNEMGIEAFFSNVPQSGMWPCCPESVLTLISDCALKENISLEIHANLGHSLTLIAPITQLAKKNKNIHIDYLHLYDDGSKEYLDLESLKHTNLHYLLNVSLMDMHAYLKKAGVTLTNPIIAQYLWGHFYPTTYHLLKKDYFIKTDFIQPIFQQIEQNCLSIDFSGQALSAQNKDCLCKMVGLNEQLQNKLKKSLNGFMFIGGITYYLGNYEINYANELLKIAKKSISGDYDALFFKPHPAYFSDKFNRPILQTINNMVEIPKELPTEALLITGLLPSKVGGVNSSIFFSLPKENIDHVVFTDKKYYSHDISNQKFIDILLRIECVKRRTIIFLV